MKNREITYAKFNFVNYIFVIPEKKRAKEIFLIEINEQKKCKEKQRDRCSQDVAELLDVTYDEIVDIILLSQENSLSRLWHRERKVDALA